MKYLFFGFLLYSFSIQAQNTLAKADELYALGNYSRAIEIYKAQPESKETLIKIAKSYTQTGNLKNALTYYEKIVSQFQEDQITTYEYAQVLKRASKNKQAEELFISLEAKDSTNPNFPYQLGLLKEEQNDTTALDYYKKALHLDPNHIHSIVKVATAMIKERRFSETDSILNHGLSIDDSHFQLWNLKALNHFYDKNYHNAIEGYEKLVELNRPSENVYQKLGYSYAAVMNHQKAIEHYTNAINYYDDKNPQTHFEIAQAYRSLRYFDKAEKHLEIAILLKEPRLEGEFMELIEIYNRQKEYKKTIEVIHLARKYYPDNEFFLYRLAIAADNYYKDKKTVLVYYENYIKQFGESGRYRLLAAERISDLKNEIHMKSN